MRPALGRKTIILVIVYKRLFPCGPACTTFLHCKKDVNVGRPLLWISTIEVCYLLSIRLILRVQWLAAPRSSAIQLCGLGLLYNYIKAWSAAQPQYTGYKYDGNSSFHSSTVCTPLASSYPGPCANTFEEALDRSPLVIGVAALSVTRYINMHVSVSGLEHQGPIFIERWSITGISSVIWAAPRCVLVRLNRVLGWNCDHFSIRIIDHSPTNYSALKDLSDHCASFLLV